MICASHQIIKTTTLAKKAIFQSGWKDGMILAAWTNSYELMPYNFSLVNVPAKIQMLENLFFTFTVREKLDLL